MRLLWLIAVAACARDDRVETAAPVPDAVPSLVVPALFTCRAVARNDTHATDQYPVPPPPFSKDIYPCTRCHDKPDDFNTTPRVLLTQHTNIHLDHGSRERWCYDCHNPSNRDRLRLASGRLIPFEISFELCGQCHGEKLRDWRAGIHGRRIGCWNGERQYLLCVNCHNPHAPKFKRMHPLPRPQRPDEIELPRSEL